LKKGKGKDYTNEGQERGRGKGMKGYSPSKGKASFKNRLKERRRKKNRLKKKKKEERQIKREAKKENNRTYKKRKKKDPYKERK